MAERVPARLTAREGRKFAFPVGIAFLLLAALVRWRGGDTLSLVFAGVGGLLLVAGVVLPSHLGPVQRAWMGFAHAISRVTTPIFMGVVYFIVLVPTGIIMRALGRNPVVHEAGDGGYWKKRDSTASDLRRQF